MADLMVIDLSSDEDELPPPVPNPDGGAVADIPNPIKLESGIEKPVQSTSTQLNVSNGLDEKNVVSKVAIDPAADSLSQISSATSDQASSSGEKELQVQEIDSSCEPSSSQLSVSSKATEPSVRANQIDSDDDIEIVSEVKGRPKKMSINTNLLALDKNYYEQAAHMFSKDTTGVAKKMVINMVKRTDKKYTNVMKQIEELKARQEYRKKVLDDLRLRYKTLQSDIFRLGNPLDVVTQCPDDASWDDETQAIKPNGYILREVNIEKLEQRTAKKSTARRPVIVPGSDEQIDLTGDDIDEKMAEDDISQLETGDPVVYELNSCVDVLVAEDPKKLSCTWSDGHILERRDVLGKPYYNIMFSIKDQLPNMTVPMDCVVVKKPQPVKYNIKQRVVAGFRSTPDSLVSVKHLSGFIGELPIQANDYKYLVLFDSGDACYVGHNDIFANFQSSFDQVLPKLKSDNETSKQAAFLAYYFDKYPIRILFNPKLGEKVRVLYDNFWYSCKVVKTRHSLMQVRIKRLKMIKWLFRGSYHLKPIYDDLFPNQRIQNAPKVQFRGNVSSSRVRKSGRATLPKRNVVVRNAEIQIDSDSDASSNGSTYSNSSINTSLRRFEKRVSKKNPQRTIREKLLNNPECPVNYIINESNLEPPQSSTVGLYKDHFCSQHCLYPEKYNPKQFRDTNPYCIPLLFGWTRVMRRCERSDAGRCICYKPPCLVSILTSEHLARFLKKTKSDLPISLFSFELELECYSEVEKIGCYYMDEDLSGGLEPKSISVINQYDTSKPDSFKYLIRPTFSQKLMNEKAVALDNKLFFDQNFNSCCSCTNQCRDPETCECQQLTYNQCKVKYPKSKSQWASGYSYRMNEGHYETGIFECNDGCPCDQNRCYNRAASLGVQHRLQLFKTKMKGWGVRTLHDIPPGCFIAAYVARILTPEEGNDDSNPDIYFADLDLLGRLEQEKQDMLLQPLSISSDEKSSSGDDERTYKYDTSEISNVPRRKDEERSRVVGQFFKIQEYLGDDCAYVMDAHEEGNIGRYFNHSCDPNAYVQNVFINTQDPRFPTICLFSARLIKAFEEITWDYGYTVGAVPDRQLWCHCGSGAKCRKRLL